MKKLETFEIESIAGGDVPWIEGLCVGAGISAIVAPNPISIGIAGGCIVKEIGDYWNWW